MDRRKPKKLDQLNNTLINCSRLDEIPPEVWKTTYCSDTATQFITKIR